MSEGTTTQHQGIVDVLCTINTPRFVRVRNPCLTIASRIGQALIVVAFIYYIVIERGYQEFEEAEGAVTTKVSGIVEANGSIFGKVNREIWDFADYVPVQENSAVFIMTNVLVTPNQTEGVCEEDPTIEDARCENRTCVAGQPVMWGNGIKTGKCVNSTREPGAKVCEIEAWCPVERDDNTTQMTAGFAGAENLTLFVRNNVEFPSFKMNMRNIPDELSYDYLWRCRYNEKDKWDKFCPTFTLDTIVRLSGYSFHQIARQGAVIEMTITWDCNLDKTRQCLPTYTFSRLDRKEHKIFRGYFFRFAEHYGDDGKSKRTLYKATGLYVVINIQGRAGKFSPTTFLVQIGGYIGLLAIVPVVLDLIIDYLPTRCVKYREEIRKRKYVHVPGTADSERQPLKHAYFHSEDSLPSLAPLRIPLGSKLVKDDIVRDLVFESTETI